MVAFLPLWRHLLGGGCDRPNPSGYGNRCIPVSSSSTPCSRSVDMKQFFTDQSIARESSSKSQIDKGSSDKNRRLYCIDVVYCLYVQLITFVPVDSIV